MDPKKPIPDPLQPDPSELHRVPDVDDRANQAFLDSLIDTDGRPMRDAIESLKDRGSVEIGWRESCGKTDPTMHEKRAWVAVLKALRADGNEISEERQKHKNAYATSKGGFWASIIYRCAP